MKTLIATVTIATLWAGVASAQTTSATQGTAPASTRSETPTNGIGGTGGGRISSIDKKDAEKLSQIEMRTDAVIGRPPIRDVIRNDPAVSIERASGKYNYSAEGSSLLRSQSAGAAGGQGQQSPPPPVVGDLNGDGKSDHRAEAAIVAARSMAPKPPIEKSGVGNGNGAPIPAKAIINTSRSNIKKPSSVASGTEIGVAPVKPAEAIINTTRSNIKKPKP